MHGTENTGYDDEAMNAYIKGDSMVQIDTEDNDLKLMLTDHRQKVLIDKMINEI